MAPVVYPQAGPAATLLALALSYLAGEVSYRWIEKPFRVGRAARARPRVAVLMALSTTVLVAGALTLLQQITLGGQVSKRQQLFIDARKDEPIIYANGCHGSIRAREVKTCDAGDKTAGRVVVLFGDSHAGHWYPALDALGAQQGWRLVSITKSACPWVDTPVEVELAGFRRPYQECDAWRTEALRRIAALKADVVVLASGSRYAGVDAGAWEHGARRTIAALRSGGAALVILRDTPWPGFNVPTCLARAEYRGANVESACAFRSDDALAPGKPIFEAEKRAAYGNAAVVDLSADLCPTLKCAVLTGETVHFSDHSHLTESFSRSLSATIAVPLQSALRLQTPSLEDPQLQGIGQEQSPESGRGAGRDHEGLEPNQGRAVVPGRRAPVGAP